MSWSSPYEWTAGEVVTAAKLNEQLYYNARYLKGLDGVVTVESGLVLDNTGGDEYLRLPPLATAEMSALDAEGKTAFDEQTNRIKFHDGTAVRSIVSTVDVDDTPSNGATTDPVSSNWAFDHVAAADPHTGYTLESVLTTRGDIYFRGASIPERLAKGTQNYFLKQGANDPEWALGVTTYTDLDGSLNQAINATTTWENFDLSGTIPAGAVAVEMHCIGYKVGVALVGVRPDGSGLARIKRVTRGNGDIGAITMTCSLPVSRIIDIYADTGTPATCVFSAMGYWK